jgi:hypothetical protein
MTPDSTPTQPVTTEPLWFAEVRDTVQRDAHRPVSLSPAYAAELVRFVDSLQQQASEVSRWQRKFEAETRFSSALVEVLRANGLESPMISETIA